MGRSLEVLGYTDGSVGEKLGGAETCYNFGMSITLGPGIVEITTEEKGLRPGSFSDPSLWFLVVANACTIYYALTEHWSLVVLMLVYWGQSIIIGLFNFLRILQLKNFSTSGFKINWREALATYGTKMFVAFFFLVHYGFFHVIYFIFIFSYFSGVGGWGVAPSIPVQASFLAIGVSVLIFFINHAFSFFYNRKADESVRRNIGEVMFSPYARIVPMHATILLGFNPAFGASGTFALPLFLVLKAVMDVVMHYAEHRKARLPGKTSEPTV